MRWQRVNPHPSPDCARSHPLPQAERGRNAGAHNPSPACGRGRDPRRRRGRVRVLLFRSAANCHKSVTRPAGRGSVMSFINATIGRLAAPERRTIGVTCGAHILHDGYTDLLYVLLPLWQAEFGLGYAAVGLMRALYVGALAGFQIPAG